MTISNIPLLATPSQQFSVILGGQNCQIAIYQKTTGLYFDLTLNDVSVVRAVICKTNNLMLYNHYSGFVGNLIFIDLQGSDDPQYGGLGVRWQLIYTDVSVPV